MDKDFETWLRSYFLRSINQAHIEGVPVDQEKEIADIVNYVETNYSLKTKPNGQSDF